VNKGDKDNKVLWEADPTDKHNVRVGPGVVELEKPKTKLQYQIEEISRNGYTVLEDCVSLDRLKFLSEQVDALYQLQVREIGDEETLVKIGDELSVKHLIVYDEIFLSLAVHKKVLDLVEQLLGEYFILNLQNGVINKSEVYHSARDFHRDLFFQHYSSSRPLAISALVCVDDFTAETGATFVLPGSHKFDAFPSPEFAKRYEKQIVAKAGSIIVLDSMAYHRAGENTSGKTRRAISQIYTMPMIKQQISLPKALNGRYVDDPFLAKFLGYESETAKNVLEWRKVRIDRRKDGGKRGRQII
jgi:ectoine hydroxylase-related dioxygenase (phytanoyl-CoA dioxygenase family)